MIVRLPRSSLFVLALFIAGLSLRQSVAFAEADLASVQRELDRWRTRTRDLPLTPEGQLRQYLTTVHPERLSYADATALARRINALPNRTMAVPPFGEVGYEQQRNEHEIEQIQARTQQLIRDLKAGRTSTRAALPELKRLRDAATRLRTERPALPTASIRITPRSTVTASPCRDRDTTVRTLYNLADAVRTAEQTVNLRENPRDVSDVLQVLSSTTVGRRLLADQRNLRIGVLTEVERKRRQLGADTQGVFVYRENAILIRTDQEMGRVMLSLVQELAHMRDETLRTEQAEFDRLAARARMLRRGAEYDRLVAQLNVLAQRSVYRRELHAWRVEAEFVAELSNRYPAFARYYRALVANELANDLPPTGDDIIRIYELDRDVIATYLRGGS